VVEQFLNHIQRHNLCKTNDKILLAVSGGIDSMVMLHLFKQAGFSIGVAHCNFQLRGNASDDDELFVGRYCDAHNIPFYTRRFNTAEIAGQEGKSVQLVARELRYAFFYELIDKYSFDAIATAHHLTDNLETVLLNLTRGTGIDGLAGIPLKNRNTIRPMMFASREAIRDFAVDNSITWREDLSNETDDYTRNLIRHQVIPHLREINQNLEHTIEGTLERIRAVKDAFAITIDEHTRQFVKHVNDQWHIDKNIFREISNAEVVLWEILKDKGFSYDQCRMLKSLGDTGKRIYASPYCLTVDRKSYILSRQTILENYPLQITADTVSITGFGSVLNFKSCGIDGFGLQRDSSIAQLDLSLISFPLTWRIWKSGDAFRPLGMSSAKKISDFLIDAKIPLPDKEKVSVLVSGEDIVWVVGFRINDKYKVTPGTRQVLIIQEAEV
jgi:tRNA(Ile)-lysidine synthase